jgi:hypothetical protein
MTQSGTIDFSLAGIVEAETQMDGEGLQNISSAAGNIYSDEQRYERARNLRDWAKDYYRIKVMPKNRFSLFRIEHLTDNDSIQITGQLDDGSWGTQQWLINKGDVRLENGKLVADDERIQDAINHMYR